MLPEELFEKYPSIYFYSLLAFFFISFLLRSSRHSQIFPFSLLPFKSASLSYSILFYLFLCTWQKKFTIEYKISSISNILFHSLPPSLSISHLTSLSLPHSLLFYLSRYTSHSLPHSLPHSLLLSLPHSLPHSLPLSVRHSIPH